MHQLQSDVNSLADASRPWNLKLNTSKCVVMRFGERITNISISDYHIDGVPLKHEPVYKEFGISVDFG